MKTILVPMANGNEDIELITIIDVLKRARDLGKADLKIICASITDDLEVTLDSGLKVMAETTLNEVDINSLDAIALAGGFGGMNNFKNDERIINILQTLHKNGKIVSAICASPIVLDKAGVLSDEFTCYPGCETGLKGKRLDESVVVRKNVITSAGPITSTYFALTLVKELGFNEQFEALLDGMLVKRFGIKF